MVRKNTGQPSKSGTRGRTDLMPESRAPERAHGRKRDVEAAYGEPNGPPTSQDERGPDIDETKPKGPSRR